MQTEYKALCPECKKHHVINIERMLYVDDFRKYKRVGFTEKTCDECRNKSLEELLKQDAVRPKTK